MLTAEERQKLESFLPKAVKESEDLDSLIAAAEMRVSRSFFRDSYIYALSLAAAHALAFLAVTASGPSGAVTSVREGDVSVNYGSANSSSGDDLEMSVYGRELITLTKQYATPFGTSAMFARGIQR